MNCISCGKEIGDNEAFCRYCGASQAVANGGNEETVLLNVNKTGKASDEEKMFAETGKTGSGTDGVVKKKNLIPLLIGCIAAIAVLAVLIFTLSAVAIYNSPEKKYDRQLSIAERYLGELDYEKAIAAYKAAIEIDPNNPEAYKMLAELYLAMDDRDSALDTVRAGIDASGDEVLSAMLTEITAVMNAADGTNGDVTEDPQSSAGNVTIKVVAANETGAISGAEVKITGEAGEFTGESDSDGKVIFDGLDYGEYTVKCDADGFHKREMTVNVSGSDVAPVVALVPDVAGDDAYILLTWNGDHDLDLCAFNTEMKEYVNIGHPIDSAGNVFLYADHGADMPYEVIYIHNASAEIAKTIYVADAVNARNGSSSQMEADGVTVRVYDSSGLIYESTADSAESAPLWCPCYYYAGTVYDQQDYIYDTTDEQYAWISFDEKDAYTAESETAVPDSEWKAAYLEKLKKSIYKDGDYTKYPDASLIYVDGDSVPELAVNVGYDGMGDTDTLMAVYTYANGQVETIFELAHKCDDPGGWYIPKEGLLMDNVHWLVGEGPEDLRDWDIIKWNGEASETLLSGYKDADYGFDENNNFEYWVNYYYYINDKAVSEQEYNSSIASTGWDDNKAKPVMDGAKSYEEMVLLLSDPSDKDLQWKTAYIDTLKNVEKNRDNSYGADSYGMLLYLDNDDIPELIWYSTEYSGAVYTYYNGKVIDVFSEYYCMDYIPDAFCQGEGIIDCWRFYGEDEVVLKLKNGALTECYSYYIYNDPMDGPDEGKKYESGDPTCLDGKNLIRIISPERYNSSWYKKADNEVLGMNYDELMNSLME